jgi:hypothetical protein
VLTGEPPTRINQEAKYFLKGKEVFVHQEDHIYNILYGYEGIPFMLPFFFVIGVLLQRSIGSIKHGLSFFIERERCKLSHFPLLFPMQQ